MSSTLNEEQAKHKTRVGDFFDPEQVKAVYYPEVERLIQDVAGAARVVMFDLFGS